MPTFNEIAVLVAEPLGRVLDDPFREMVKARAKYWRSKLLRDTLNKNSKDRVHFIQYITLGLQQVSAVDCGIPLDCKVMKTINPVPVPLRANSMIFDYVGSPDGSNPFTPTTRAVMKFKLQDKYAPLVSTYYTWENRYIVLPKNRMVQKVMIGGIFDDPEAAFLANCDAAADCNFYEAEYPVSGDIAQQIVQYILQVDFARSKDDDDDSIVKPDKDDDDRKAKQ